MRFFKQLALSSLAAAMILALLAGPLASAQNTPPDSVELEYFIGTAVYPSHILLEWQSVSEQDTQGYRLKRGTTPDPLQVITIAPFIPGNPGSPLGYYYSYQDTFNLVPGTTYYYWIEDQSLSGSWITYHNDPSLNPIVPWGCSRYDVVCNFAIDAQDIAAIAGRWNCAQGSACFDGHYDLNGDWTIDVRDVMLDAARWGCVIGQACYSD